MVLCIRRAPSHDVETSNDGEDEPKYFNDVIPSLGGEGKEIGSGSCCAIIIEWRYLI